MSSTWSITESRFDAATAKAWEGLFTLGSGYLHVRGSLEEHLSDAPQNAAALRMPANVTSEVFDDTKAKWGTYIPGVFGSHPFLNSEMINLPFFLGLVPGVAGERLDVERGRIKEYLRELRMDTATLSRSMLWSTVSGVAVRVKFERFVSAARPSLCVQRMTLLVESEADVEIDAQLDADVRTNGYDHFESVSFDAVGPGAMGCRVVTDQGDHVDMVTRMTAPGISWRFSSGGRTASLNATTRLASSEPLVIEKRTAVRTTRDLVPTEAKAVLQDAACMTYDELHAEHAEAWSRRWSRCDVEIEGDEEAQRAMRVSLFHLLRAHVPADNRVAIDAKGYAGEAYWGRFFWDTEMYMLPFYVHTDPDRAKTLADFRVQSLPGAMANARRYGYPGARYAWESDADGNECCPNWQYADHEVHVTADVVYGLVYYARANASDDYLRGPAARVLVETARYWLGRVDPGPGEGDVSLLGVMGPDEYTPICDNNCYTNRLVRFALAAAAEYGDHGGADASERAEFRRVSDRLPLPRHEDGLLVWQCDAFAALADPRFEELWKDRTRSFAAQVSQERLYRSKCLKQADVLMMMMLFPGEFTDREVQRAWTYYQPYTTHDSSLSAGIHAIVALRLGLDDEAWRFWESAKSIDLDVKHGGAAEGIHIAGAAANWMVAVLGFGGMKTAMQSETLTLHPRLPKCWSRLAFPIVWHRCPVHVEILPGSVRVLNQGSESLRVQVHDEERSIAPDEQSTWEVGA